MRMLSMWVVVLVVLLAASCGKKSPQDCSADTECGDGEVCTAAGVCRSADDPNNEPECNGDPDCPGGFECIANMCEQISLDMGAPNNGVDMGSPNNGDDMSFDNIPPEVVSVTPEDLTTDVDLDAAVTIVFSEALRATSVNIQSIELRDPANGVVTADLSYDDATFTVTVTPQAPLRQATPYRLVVTTFVRDAADNALAEQHESKFYTTYPEPTGVRAVAERWAPHIYQAIGDTTGGNPNVDLPTTVDFDGNLRARDNKSRARLNSTRNTAAVYYNVLETKTHYFVVYALYYPLRLTEQGDYEHDFAGAVLVVDKATDALVLVDGVKVQTGADTNLGFKPSTSSVNGVGAPQQFDEFDAAALEDGTHYPMFVPAGEHEACAFPVDGNVPYCLHNGGEFPGAGVWLKPGQGQRYADAVDAVDPLYPNDGNTYQEMTYELVPLPSTLWVRRTDVGSELLYQATQIYSPSGEDRPSMTSGGAPIVLPTLLVSDDDTTYGKPPFLWLRTSTQNNHGQWLLDPAYLLLNKYDFGEPWSQEYCYNVFFDVNLRGNAAHPECGSDG